jgi:hypothetical protein
MRSVSTPDKRFDNTEFDQTNEPTTETRVGEKYQITVMRMLMRDVSRSKKLSHVRRDIRGSMNRNGGGTAGGCCCCCDGDRLTTIGVVGSVDNDDDPAIGGGDADDDSGDVDAAVALAAGGGGGGNGTNVAIGFAFHDDDDDDVALKAFASDDSVGVDGVTTVRSSTLTSCTPSNDSSNDTTLSLPPRFAICVGVKTNEQLYCAQRVMQKFVHHVLNKRINKHHTHRNVVEAAICRAQRTPEATRSASEYRRPF